MRPTPNDPPHPRRLGRVRPRRSVSAGPGGSPAGRLRRQLLASRSATASATGRPCSAGGAWSAGSSTSPTPPPPPPPGAAPTSPGELARWRRAGRPLRDDGGLPRLLRHRRRPRPLPGRLHGRHRRAGRGRRGLGRPPPVPGRAARRRQHAAFNRTARRGSCAGDRGLGRVRGLHRPPRRRARRWTCSRRSTEC